MKNYINKTILAISAIALLASCKKDTPQGGEFTYKEPKLPETRYPYKQQANKLPSTNVNVSDAEATLGRVLFYEKALSANNLISCGSCHIQSMGFADGRQFSPGFEFLTTPRNSPGISNPGSMNSFFWDARAKSGLEEMVTMPVQNHLEMGIENLDYAVAKINAIPYYKELFIDAYGTEKATKQTIAQALANFLASMTVTNTRFDKAKSGSANALNELEKQGQELFNSLHCKSCHDPNLANIAWTSDVFANIGLDADYEDNGMYDPENPDRNSNRYKGVFKTPSLRNVALTAPYMHDGRFKTLEEVIEHYSTGVKQHPNLNWNFTNSTQRWRNQTLPSHLQRPITGNDSAPVRLNLNANEKTALIAFLKSLTDEAFVGNPMYSDPFNY